MNSTITRPARRIATTLAAAGIAVLGTVAIAPAASADTGLDTPAYIIDGPGVDNGNGPDRFIIIGTRHVPVFFCDVEDPTKHENKCVPTGVDGERF